MGRFMLLVPGICLGFLVGLFIGATITQKNPNNIKADTSEKGKALFVANLDDSKTLKSVVIYCNEQRFQKPFEEFVKNFLKLKENDTIPIPGGPRWFAIPTETPEEIGPLKRTAIEILKRHSPQRIILIMHSDCIVDDAIAAWRDEKIRVKGYQIEQIQTAKNFFKEWFPDATIEIYFAQREGNKLLFNPVE